MLEEGVGGWLRVFQGVGECWGVLEGLKRFERVLEDFESCQKVLEGCRRLLKCVGWCWTLPSEVSASAMMTLPSTERDWLMFDASFSLSPCVSTPV